MTATSVFISYNTADEETASEIGLMLASEGIGVLYDQWEVVAGDSVTGWIDGALGTCTHFVLLWSASAASSSWVTEERRVAVTRAVKTKQPRVIPIRLDAEPLPPLLTDKRYLEWGKDQEANWSGLIAGIRGSRPEHSMVKSLVLRYHELIYQEDPHPMDPLPYRYCPRCAGESFQRSSRNYRDDNWYFISCDECGWSDWSQ